MADVPDWLLIFNTLAVGGFGLAGSFIMPKAQRETLKAERERANADTMRERATEIFQEIAALDSEAAQVAINAIRKRNNEMLPPDAPKIRGLETLRAQLAVYYPAALPIIAAYDAKLLQEMVSIRAKFEAANAKPLAERANAIGAVEVEMLMLVWSLVGDTVKKVRTFMIDAVKPYVPSAPVKALTPQ